MTQYTLTEAPQRQFLLTEFEQRLARAQTMMRALKLDAVLLTTETNVRYFSGYFTQFWQSPTRPWFLILPLTGKPIAVIPTIGVVGMSNTWVEDIRAWPSPFPEDDGVSLLSQTLAELPKRFGRLGMTLGRETHLRMPQQQVQSLYASNHFDLVDVSREVLHLRSLKSAAEINRVAHICGVTSNAFAELPNFARIGMTEREVVAAFRMELLRQGADHSPFIVSSSGPDGYDDIIMGPTDRLIESGDVLIIDTGTVWQGYFCDFDRNWCFGDCSDETKSAYRTVYQATNAGFEAAKPGNTTSDLYRAMWPIMHAGGALGNDVGRLGHGLGSDLTEWPSNTATDDTVLEVGMIMTLEPGMSYLNKSGQVKQMVHEENIVITEEGAQWLSIRAAAELPLLG
ncbi:Xaa-Pro peptidase family protein [Oceanospirillaceae bacterium]|jgi:Xaa-Pro dipeptidase|nr:aminopeptidase P family protein [Oceanospirillaceae bacterium]MDB0065318.1 Xaa-Pro peptidase family protein [Oceanospirillaceae bacterium]MDC0092457.1 Xaa-Pro peptidase family protein [Oceanospirillaceae bacterium]MDC1507989.1 Xaa-Pro peptidase family protein [Oceanospirillaceae bacterium]